MHVRLRFAILLSGGILSGCGDATSAMCVVGDLPQSSWCGDDGTDCIALADLSQGCIGSHVEQDCKLGEETYVRVPESDSANLFFGTNGALVAVQVLGQGSGDCMDDWFGPDLSTCALVGEPKTVNCDPPVGEGG